jgi:S-ribosylhomocysteine lyase
LLLRDNISTSKAISLVKASFEFIMNFEGNIPGTSKIECGNYLEHNLNGAKEVAKDMFLVLKDWTEKDTVY